MSNDDTMRGWILGENGRVSADDGYATLIHDMPLCSETKDALRHSAMIAATPKLLIACKAIVLAAKLGDPAAGAVAATLAATAIAEAEDMKP